MKGYFWPNSLEEAISLLESKKSARPIAGGTEINLKYKDVEYLVDLKNLGLNYIKNSGNIRIGATTTIAEIEASPLLKQKQFKALHQAAHSFTQSVKHLATIGGNIAEGVPSSDLAPGLIALDAKAVLVSSKGIRILPVHELFRGLRKTVIDKGEILKEFILPIYSKDTSSSFQKVGRTEDDLAMTSLAVRLTIDEERLKDVGIGLGLAAPFPLKAKRAEDFLKANGLLLEEASEVLIQETNPRSSIRASREYRLVLEKVLFKKAILECLEGLK
jgi:CO/xanthine dehydrogenase FAD-binding subunit